MPAPKAASKPLNILIAASEVYPFSESAGLALAVGEQALEMARQGHHVTVVSPWYEFTQKKSQKTTREVPEIGLLSEGVEIPFDNPNFSKVDIGRAARKTVGKGSITYLFVKHGEDFTAEKINDVYNAGDAVDRFMRFCRAVPFAAAAAKIKPDVIHAHDWTTAFLPAIIKHSGDSPRLLPKGFSGLPCVFTIHNANHDKTIYDIDWAINALRLPRKDPSEMHMHYVFGDGSTRCSAMWMGAGNADKVIAVSETYAKELVDPNYGYRSGLNLELFKDKVVGVTNGVNMDRWSPLRDTGYKDDPKIPDTPEETDAKHPFCKDDLLYGLSSLEKKNNVKIQYLSSDERALSNPIKPNLCFLGRQGHQKGTDLLIKALPEILKQGWNVTFGGPIEGQETREQLEALERQFKGRFTLRGRYVEEPRLNKFFAAADAMLIPSRHEPCGQAQQQGLRYGAVPILSAVGGHKDTVVTDGADRDGFLFDPPPTVEKIVAATKEAMLTYVKDKDAWEAAYERAQGEPRYYMDDLDWENAKSPEWEAMQKAGMRKDLSWEVPVQQSIDTYRDVIKACAVGKSR